MVLLTVLLTLQVYIFHLTAVGINTRRARGRAERYELADERVGEVKDAERHRVRA